MSARICIAGLLLLAGCEIFTPAPAPPLVQIAKPPAAQVPAAPPVWSSRVIPVQPAGNWRFTAFAYNGQVTYITGLGKQECLDLKTKALPQTDFNDTTGVEHKPAEGNIRTATCDQP